MNMPTVVTQLNYTCYRYTVIPSRSLSSMVMPPTVTQLKYIVILLRDHSDTVDLHVHSDTFKRS